MNGLSKINETELVLTDEQMLEIEAGAKVAEAKLADTMNNCISCAAGGKNQK